MMPSSRIVGSTRGSFPNPNEEGAEKHPVLNHLASFDWALPPGFSTQPAVTLGRGVPAPKLVLNVVAWAVRTSGNPLCTVVSPSAPQPEISPSIGAGRLCR